MLLADRVKQRIHIPPAIWHFPNPKYEYLAFFVKGEPCEDVDRPNPKRMIDAAFAIAQHHGILPLSSERRGLLLRYARNNTADRLFNLRSLSTSKLKLIELRAGAIPKIVLGLRDSGQKLNDSINASFEQIASSQEDPDALIERAAIIEFDGKVSRDEAERRAITMSLATEHVN